MALSLQIQMVIRPLRLYRGRAHRGLFYGNSFHPRGFATLASTNGYHTGLHKCLRIEGLPKPWARRAERLGSGTPPGRVD